MDPLPPLRFTPIFKTALWGGDRLPALLRGPARRPTRSGEAWVLSDCADQPSVVADGPLAGTTLRDLMRRMPDRLLGRATAPHGRFPLLVKFLHARQPLSVQVHPTDAQARRLEGPTAVGKTEAWVILEADPDARVYAGLPPAATADTLRRAILREAVEDLLYAHAPQPGDCFFLPAGTVHAIGGGLVLFEVQQTSDLTYRLYDWGRMDPKTGQAAGAARGEGAGVRGLRARPVPAGPADDRGPGPVPAGPAGRVPVLHPGPVGRRPAVRDRGGGRVPGAGRDRTAGR